MPSSLVLLASGSATTSTASALRLFLVVIPPVLAEAESAAGTLVVFTPVVATGAAAPVFGAFSPGVLGSKAFSLGSVSSRTSSSDTGLGGSTALSSESADALDSTPDTTASVVADRGSAAGVGSDGFPADEVGAPDSLNSFVESPCASSAVGASGWAAASALGAAASVVVDSAGTEGAVASAVATGSSTVGGRPLALLGTSISPAATGTKTSSCVSALYYTRCVAICFHHSFGMRKPQLRQGSPIELAQRCTACWRHTRHKFEGRYTFRDGFGRVVSHVDDVRTTR